jgi:hypothetical protein
MLGWEVWDAQDSREPTTSRTAQTRFEMNESPKILRRDTIESRSSALIKKVMTQAVAKMVTKIMGTARTGNRSSATRGARRIRFEIARRIERIENDGRTNRCRYRRANCSVAEEPCRLIYPNSSARNAAAVVDEELDGDGKTMFAPIDVMISAIEATSTISGLIFTPSVSSSKKRSNPALDAGSGLFFLLLLIIWSLPRRAGAF